MKILMWTAYYFPDIGGLERMTQNLCKTLKEAGHHVAIITGNNFTSPLQCYEVDGMQVHSFPFIQALGNLKLPMVKSILLALKKIINDFDPDIIHIHGWIEAIAFFQARTIQNMLTMITSHGVVEHYDYNTKNAITVWNHAKMITTVSDSVKNSLNEKNFLHDHVYRIYNGIPVSKTAFQCIQRSPKKLLMIGRLSAEKCFNVGFEALKILTEKYPDLFLTLIGGGPLFKELFHLKAKLNLENNACMLGFVPHEKIESYIDDADIILVPSDYESFCLVAVEAAMRGRPVIASGVYGLQEVIDDGVTGMLVPPHDSDALAAAIEKLILNPVLAFELGNAARKKALHHFTVDKMTESYLNLYSAMIENKNVTETSQCDYSCA